MEISSWDRVCDIEVPIEYFQYRRRRVKLEHHQRPKSTGLGGTDISCELWRWTLYPAQTLSYAPVRCHGFAIVGGALYANVQLRSASGLFAWQRWGAPVPHGIGRQGSRCRLHSPSARSQRDLPVRILTYSRTASTERAEVEPWTRHRCCGL